MATSAPAAATLDFHCNICGEETRACPQELIDREVASCATCGSTVRGRSVVHLLSVALFGRSLAISDFPPAPKFSGIGLSDWHVMAEQLSAKLDYVNTFIDREPRLDITRVADHPRRYDFLISSEVFEHVPPPVSRAFDGAFTLLKPGGHLILTVPYRSDTVTLEHFPELDDYTIVQLTGGPVLVNRTADRRLQAFDSLCFHGGGGATLEMRVFGAADLEDHLRQAGFRDIRFHGEHVLHWGIVQRRSQPITARRPA